MMEPKHVRWLREIGYRSLTFTRSLDRGAAWSCQVSNPAQMMTESDARRHPVKHPLPSLATARGRTRMIALQALVDQLSRSLVAQSASSKHVKEKRRPRAPWGSN